MHSRHSPPMVTSATGSSNFCVPASEYVSRAFGLIDFTSVSAWPSWPCGTVIVKTCNNRPGIPLRTLTVSALQVGCP